MDSPTALPRPDDRRQALLAAKLRALVKRWEPATTIANEAPPRVPVGAAGLVTTAGEAWFLAEDGGARLTGSALVWLDRTAAQTQHVVMGDTEAAVAALRLAAFTRRPNLYRVDATAIVPVAVPALHEAVLGAGPPLVFDRAAFVAGLPDATQPVADTLLAALASIDALTAERDQHGVHFTVRGLEVARFAMRENRAHLDIGVGKFDRHARHEIAGDQPLDEKNVAGFVDALRAAVAAILERRRADAPEHQIRSLRKERWLRACVIADPTIAGLPGGTDLTPMAPPVAPPDLISPSAAPALGTGEVVVCSTGIDLDLVPAAAHAWLLAAGAEHPRLTVAVPEGDDHPVTRTLLALLAPELHARIVTVAPGWMAG